MRTKNDGRFDDKSCILVFGGKLFPYFIIQIESFVLNRVLTYLCNIPAVKAVNKIKIGLDSTKHCHANNAINIDDISTDT